MDRIYLLAFLGMLTFIQGQMVIPDQPGIIGSQMVDFEPETEQTAGLRHGQGFDLGSCHVEEDFRSEIKSYADTVKKIFEATTEGTGQRGPFVGKTYQDLGYFVDKFGSRLSGSRALERSIDFIEHEMEVSGLKNVHTENATVPHWQRGNERAELILPRQKSLAVMALGFSVPTPKDGLISDAIVVTDWKTLIGQQRDDIKGKILVYAGNSSGLSLFGAGLSAEHGAVACLMRSQTPMSLNTPHAGIQYYDPTKPKIPIAAISPEDADLISRLSKMGDRIRIFLQLEVVYDEVVQSRNIIGDYMGRQNPAGEMVLVSGHIDSWDVGQGAADDGVGLMLSLEVTRLFKHLDLTPRRTVRTVAWTAEEMGLYGAAGWMKEHKRELSRYVAALESDYGCFKAMGYIFTGKQEVGCILNEIRNLMPPIANLSVTKTIFMPTDVAYMAAAGVPSVVLNGNDGKYFWYHHTEADVLTAMDSKELDICLAVWASTTFILADMKQTLPPSFKQASN